MSNWTEQNKEKLKEKLFKTEFKIHVLKPYLQVRKAVS
jgi:hypothetical protein